MNSVSTPQVLTFLEDLVDAEELEEILARPAGQVRAELLADGVDLERMRVLRDHALGKGPAPAPRQPRAKVIPIASRAASRPSRVIPILRSISVAVAAGFFGIFVWKQESMHVGPGRGGRPELSDSRPAPPPSYMVDTRVQQATRLRAEAYNLCDRGYWAECQDKLDDAARLDQAGNMTLEVNEARSRIGRGMDAETHGDIPMYAKPSLGPGERPLQRTPHR